MQQLAIAEITELKPYPRHDEFLDDLEGKSWDKFLYSVNKNGIIFNILVTQDGVIVDGYKRYKACKVLGIRTIPCKVKTYDTEDDVLKDLISFNIGSARYKYIGSPAKFEKMRSELSRICGAEPQKNNPKKEMSNDLKNIQEPYTFEPLSIDPDFEKLLPELTNEEFQSLKANLIKNGFSKAFPICTWHGYIVDGHNRYRICRKENIPYVTTPLNFETKDEVLDWIYRTQMGRRNLSHIQKIEVSLKMESVYKRMAKKNQGTRNDLNSNFSKTSGKSCNPQQKQENKRKDHSKETDAKLAKQVGISRDTYRKAKRILQSENECVKSKVKSGEMSISAGYKVISEKKSPPNIDDEIDDLIKRLFDNKEK